MLTADPPRLATSPRAAASLLGWVREHPWTTLLVLGLPVLGLSFLGKPEALSEWDHVYLRTAQRMIQGTNIYAFTEGYLYPPVMAWLAIPFTWLPGWGNRLAFFLINAGCLAGLCRWTWQLSGGGRLEAGGVERREHLICAVGLLLGLRYSLDALAHQQTDVIIAALLVGGCLLLVRGHWLFAATCFGLAAGFKCTALLWCLYLVLRGRWLSALWVVVVAVGINLLPDLTCPHSGHWWLVEWFNRYLSPMRGSSYQPGTWGSALIYNQSLAGLLNRWCCTEWEWAGDILDCLPKQAAWSAGQLKLLVGGVSLALLAGMAWLWWRPRAEELAQRGQQGLQCSAVLLLMVLLSPMSSKPHFATLLLPAFLLARLAVERHSTVLWLMLGAAALTALVGTRDLVGKYLAQLALYHGSVTWSTLLLLAGVMWTLRWRSESVAPASSGIG